MHSNRCGASDHLTNQCPHHPFVKREEVHLLQEGCCSESTETSEFEFTSDDENILLNHQCKCDNPKFCSCEEAFGSDSIFSPRQHRGKLKVCMYHSTGDQEAQMLAQIKALPEGDMKNSLLRSFLESTTTK